MAEENDQKMLEYLKALNVPEMKDIDDFKRFMTQYGTPSQDIPLEERTTPRIRTQMQVPRIAIFFGEEGKGEVSFETWAYEVRCLKAEKIYSDEILLQAIRRSLRGHAADQLRYIGTRPTVDDILDYFSSTYGLVETPESILKKFYACKQTHEESVMKYCIRLEEIHAEAIEMKVLSEGDGMLKRVFYRGLSPQLKHLSAFKFETVSLYKDFKREVRQIENELCEDEIRSTLDDVKTHCHQNTKKEDRKEKNKTDQQFNDLTTMLEKLNTRLESLEKQQETVCKQQVQCEARAPADYQQQGYQQQSIDPNYNQQYYPNQSWRGYNQQSYDPNYNQQYYPNQRWRGHKHNRGSRGYRPRGQHQYTGRGRGDNQYKTQRPLATNTFQPECYACHQRGHLARNCPLNE